MCWFAVWVNYCRRPATRMREASELSFFIFEIVWTKMRNNFTFIFAHFGSAFSLLLCNLEFVSFIVVHLLQQKLNNLFHFHSLCKIFRWMNMNANFLPLFNYHYLTTKNSEMRNYRAEILLFYSNTHEFVHRQHWQNFIIGISHELQLWLANGYCENGERRKCLSFLQIFLLQQRVSLFLFLQIPK